MKNIIIVFAMLLYFASPLALGSLIGDTVNYCVSFNNGCLASPTLEGSLGPIDADFPELELESFEVDGGSIGIEIDIGAESIAFDLFWTPSDEEETNTYTLPAFQLVLSDMNWLDQNGEIIPGKIIAFESDGEGDEPEGTTTSFTDNSIAVLFPEVSFDPEELDQIYASFAITAEHDDLTGGVEGEIPVPATIALFCVGLAGLGWSTRKKV